jgi:diguanylate cyclase (GGDEF)-like protein
MQQSVIKALLINEDRDQYVQLLRLLESIPFVRYEMTWCADYRHALEAMLAGIHDVVLLDFENAPSTCHELLRAANAHDCDTPIICLTPTIDPDLDQAAIKSGAADYLPKSGLDAARLERTVRYAIDRKHNEAELARLAHYDLLTGIPNRLLFNDRLDRALQRGVRGEQPFALLYIDLDGFKAINDAHGHDAGDAIVKGVAQRLNDSLRRTDSVARIGGDEFTVLLEKVSTTAEISAIVQKIIDLVVEPFEFNGKHLRVGCSVGIAVYPSAGSDAQSLLRNADMAMYEAKGIAGSNFRFFTEKMNVEAVDQNRLELELRNAITQDELELYYQPRISLRSGKVVGVEALLRWQHPERGMVLPGEFIALAEHTGLIHNLGFWALERLCSDITELDQLKVAPLRFSLNVSMRQFAEDEFFDSVLSVAQRSRVSLGRLEFELAEADVLANIDQLSTAMSKLSDKGVHFSLDDFGTGLSSLPQLQQLPIGSLKLDSSHVQNISNNEDSANIVRAMIYLAHGLGLQVIAEGVETQEQQEFLAKNRCDQLQGYVYSAPLPFDEFATLVQRSGVTSRRSYLSVVDH